VKGNKCAADCPKGHVVKDGLCTKTPVLLKGKVFKSASVKDQLDLGFKTVFLNTIGNEPNRAGIADIRSNCAPNALVLVGIVNGHNDDDLEIAAIDNCRFALTPLIRNKDGKHVTQRHPDSNVNWFNDEAKGGHVHAED